MQSILLKIVGGLIALLLGGIFVWWLIGTHPQNTAQTGLTNQQGNYYGGNTQTTVTSPENNQSQSQTQAQTLDIEAAYNQLFQQILAQKVQFTSVMATSTGDSKIIYGMYANDITAEEKAHPTLAPLGLDIALVDLTNDGVSEALVYENLPDYCGPGGCTFDIYQKENGKWIKIYTDLVGGIIGVSNTLTNGHLDLFLTAEGSPAVDRYVWNGSKYEAKETMALWTGSSFQVAQ